MRGHISLRHPLHIAIDSQLQIATKVSTSARQQVRTILKHECLKLVHAMLLGCLYYVSCVGCVCLLGGPEGVKIT